MISRQKRAIVKVAEILPEAQQVRLLELRSRLPSKWSAKWARVKSKTGLMRSKSKWTK